MAIYEINGWFFADEVDRAFGENIVVPVVGLCCVLPANDYVRQHGRNLTTGAVDLGDSAAPEDNQRPEVLSAGQGKSTPAPNH